MIIIDRILFRQVEIESGSSTKILGRIFHVNPTPLAYKRKGRGGLNPRNHNTTDAHRT
jgi:hypothetical protein